MREIQSILSQITLIDLEPGVNGETSHLQKILQTMISSMMFLDSKTQGPMIREI